MAHSCNNCGETKKPSSVPYTVLVDFKETAKANSLKWFIFSMVLLVLFVGSNCLWIYRESQYEDVVTTETITQEVEQDADNGENYFVGGDMVGETEDKNNENQSN